MLVLKKCKAAGVGKEPAEIFKQVKPAPAGSSKSTILVLVFVELFNNLKEKISCFSYQLNLKINKKM